MKVTLFRQSVFLAGSRHEHDELMLVITNADPTVAIATYLRRWEIETLFQSLKGRGFRFEGTHVTQLDRLASLVGFTALAFAWADKVGEWQALKQPIRWKRFGTQWRPQASYFKVGLGRIRDCLSHMTVKTSQFRDLIEQLCTPKPSPGVRQ